MAQGRVITKEVKDLIARVYLKHPKWTAKEIQTEVNLTLRDKDKTTPKDWPGLSAVQKLLAPLRAKKDEAHPEDESWNLGTLEEAYPLPNEAIPAVLEVWANRLEDGLPFSIREAKWVARLAGVLDDRLELSERACQYADFERIFKMLADPVDTTLLDRLLMGFQVTELLDPLYSLYCTDWNIKPPRRKLTEEQAREKQRRQNRRDEFKARQARLVAIMKEDGVDIDVSTLFKRPEESIVTVKVDRPVQAGDMVIARADQTVNGGKRRGKRRGKRS